MFYCRLVLDLYVSACRKIFRAQGTEFEFSCVNDSAIIDLCNADSLKKFTAKFEKSPISREFVIRDSFKLRQIIVAQRLHRLRHRRERKSRIVATRAVNRPLLLWMGDSTYIG